MDAAGMTCVDLPAHWCVWACSRAAPGRSRGCAEESRALACACAGPLPAEAVQRRQCLKDSAAGPLSRSVRPHFAAKIGPRRPFAPLRLQAARVPWTAPNVPWLCCLRHPHRRTFRRSVALVFRNFGGFLRGWGKCWSRGWGWSGLGGDVACVVHPDGGSVAFRKSWGRLRRARRFCGSSPGCVGGCLLCCP